MSRPTDQLDNSHTKPLQMEHHEQMSFDRSQTDRRPENSESQARQFLPNSLIARERKARSSQVRRLVQAEDDPTKQRIRRWLSKINNEQLRGSRSAGKFVSPSPSRKASRWRND